MLELMEIKSGREKTNKKLDIDTILGYVLPNTIVLSLLLIFLLKAVPTGLEPREIIYHGLFGFVLLLWMVNIILICIHVVGILNFSDIRSTKIKKCVIIVVTIFLYLIIMLIYLVFVSSPVNRVNRGQEFNNGDGTILVKYVNLLHPDEEYISTYKSKFFIYRYKI